VPFVVILFIGDGNVVHRCELRMSIILFLGFTFLSVPVHSRIIYSGSAFSSHGGEVENLFWNPAGMGGEGYISSTHNYSGVTYGCLGLVKKVGIFHLGAGITFMNSRNIIKTDATGSSLGEFSYYSLVPIFAGEYERGSFVIGGKLSLPYSATDIYDSYGLGMDLGLIYEINEWLSFSAYVKNIGIQLNEFVTEKEDFPAEVRLGSRYGWDRYSFSIEYSYPLGFSTSIISSLNKNFELIVGYNGGLRELNKAGDLDSITGLSVGFRFYYKKIVLDIGAVSYGVLGISKTIAINWSIK